MKEIIGQREAKEKLEKIIAHAKKEGIRYYQQLFFTGIDGSCKKTCGRILTEMLKNCGILPDADFLVFDAAKENIDANTKVLDDIVSKKGCVLYIEHAEKLKKNLVRILIDVAESNGSIIIFACTGVESRRITRFDERLSDAVDSCENNTVSFSHEYSPEELKKLLVRMLKEADRLDVIRSSVPLKADRKFLDAFDIIARRLTRKNKVIYARTRFLKRFINDCIDNMIRRNPLDTTLHKGDIPSEYRSLFSWAVVSLPSEKINTDKKDNDTKLSDLIEKDCSCSIVWNDMLIKGKKTNNSIGTIVTGSGYMITARQCLEDYDEISTTLFAKDPYGFIHESPHNCIFCIPDSSYDNMAILQIEKQRKEESFHPVSIRPAEEQIKIGEKVVILSRSDDEMRCSYVTGRVRKQHMEDGKEIYDLDLNLEPLCCSGYAGSPVFGIDDGRMIGFLPGEDARYFCPMNDFWSRCTKCLTFEIIGDDLPF